MSDFSSYLSTRNKQWSAKLWDSFIEAVSARLAPLEEQLDIQKEVADAIVARGLTVIEQELAPIVAQADQILDESTASINAKLARFEQKVTGGTVISMSNSSASLANGSTINLTLIPADREFFAPTPFLAISRASTVANWAIAKVNSFNRSTGALSVTLEQVNGAGGPYTDWIITSLPGATLLQKDYYEKTLALRAQVADDKVKTGEDRAAALAHKNDASDAAALSVAARNGSAQAFADMRKAIAVPLVTPIAPEIGQIWWDGNVVRVYDGVGFVPTVTASIGGLRFDEGSFPAGTDGVITIAGGFRFVMIWLNGALLYESRGDFVSATPDITIPSATEGDEWKYWAYQAIDATDYDTKEQVNEKIATALSSKTVLVSEDQTFTPLQKGQFLANIGGGVLAGFRNKIINGGFDVWMRGEGFNNPSSPFVADRWRVAYDVAGSFSINRSFGGAITLLGSPYSYLSWIQTSGPAASYRALMHRIEGVHTLAGKKATFTLTGWSDANRVIEVELRQWFGDGGSSLVSVGRKAIPLTVSPRKKSITFDVPAVSAKIRGTTPSYLELVIYMPSSGDFTVNLSRVSLVEGDATKEDDPFSPRHIQQEEALCKRYFNIVQGNVRADVPRIVLISSPVFFPPMRTTPSTSVSGGITHNVQSNGNFVASGNNSGRLEVSTGGEGDAYWLDANIRLDAEL